MHVMGHKNHGFLEGAGFFLYHCLEVVSSKNLPVVLGVDFKSIFNPTRPNRLVLYDTNPYQNPTSTFLVPELK